MLVHLSLRLKAEEHGYTQVLWLDGQERKYVEEVGSMNIMFLINDTVVTAPLEGSVLPGVTRDSMLTILRDWGYKVEERHLSVDELMEAGRTGALKEAWGTGTAKQLFLQLVNYVIRVKKFLSMTSRLVN